MAGQIKDAQVRGNPLVLRSVLGYVSASRAAQGGSKAFMDATKFLVANMLRSTTKKIEIEMLYGQMGYGTVKTTPTTTTIEMTTAEWAAGIWGGAEGMPIEIRDVFPHAASRGETTITAVSLENRTITVAALPAGTLATDVIFHKGAYGNEFAGVHKILTNTGTLFNISATSYNLWKGSSYDVSPGPDAPLSFQKVQNAVARAVEKGLDSDVMVLVNPKTWADLLQEQAALRMYDSSYKSAEAEQGAQSIKFHGQNGVVEISPSIFVKEGYAYALCLDEFIRVGSSDITFKRPGNEGEFFRELENSAGYELRCYTDQALFCMAPGKNVVLYGIVNSA